jgi:hypothetical protein
MIADERLERGNAALHLLQRLARDLTSDPLDMREIARSILGLVLREGAIVNVSLRRCPIFRSSRLS